jgi:glycosyltransferase involved in cell wall biosynthesis
LTVEQREKGREILKDRAFFPDFSFCFVGRLDDDKGVQHIIDAFGKLEKMATVEKIHFIGNGPKLDYYKNECKRLKIPAVFLGFLGRDEVFEIYKKCDFMLLPSKSEGFPKVIAEAMNFGCIPMVSNISCIGQYVNRENGYTFYPITSDRLKEIIKEAIAQNGDALKNKAINCHSDTANFTFEHYRERIQKEIIN